MKKKLSTFLLAGAVSVAAGCAMPYAPQEFDFSELACAPGIVESVREVDLQAGLHPFAAALELWMQPDLGDELLVRLDDGRAVKVVQNGLQRFEAGERVRVLFDAQGARLERE